MLVVFCKKQPTVMKQSSIVNYLMQSVTSTMLSILFCNWLHITVRFILGYVVRRLVNNQVLRKIIIAVKSDVKNWAYISLR